MDDEKAPATNDSTTSDNAGDSLTEAPGSAPVVRAQDEQSSQQDGTQDGDSLSLQPEDDAPKDNDDSDIDQEDAEPSKESNEDDKFDKWHRSVPRKTSINWCNLESFKARFSRDEGFDIIEVLVGYPDHVTKDLKAEKSKRTRKSQGRAKPLNEGDHRYIHRVRIQSRSIIYLLCRLTGQDEWSHDLWRTFLRPFQTFYYTLPLVKQAHDILERRCNEREDTEKASLAAGSALRRAATFSLPEVEADPLQKLSLPLDIDVDEITSGISDAATAVQHIKLYVDFVEEHIVPMWKAAAGTTKPRVRFTDLPMYYRPGDILFEPQGTEDRDGSEKAKSGSRDGSMHVYQNIWKLCFTELDKWDSEPPNDHGEGIKKQSLALFSYHIDWDGEKYGIANSRSTIWGYEGKRDIRSFTLYPLRFANDMEKMKEDLRRRGEKFISFVEKRHLYYDGWTLIHDTYSADAKRDLGRQTVEHIEGEIMVDFKEGFQSDADFVKPSLPGADFPTGSSSSEADASLSVDWYSDASRSSEIGGLYEIIQTSERFNVFQIIRLRNQDKVLRAVEDEERVSVFEADHMLLFSQRLIAYSFRARKFFVANIDFVSNISAPKNTFRDLRIKPENKRMLKSLVGTHFQKQHIRRQHKNANLDQDFIRGKGSGLIILLHGVPGVGKTTTAESVAMSSRKPLYTLTNGDLGSTPRDVEKALRETFRLATLWDCVLLLDEADLFLTKRDVGDIERNSLVSVFLRVLDYYDGVLFLTTNRVGTIDEAFRSRIHLTLYYPPLKRQQAIEIFQVNIRRLKEIERSKADLLNRQTAQGNPDTSIIPIEIDDDDILRFADEIWEKTPPNRRWNGRQIRNAFQVAYSLVHFKRLKSTEPEWDEEDENDWEDGDDDDEEAGDPSSGSGHRTPTTNLDMSAAATKGKPAKLDRTQFHIVAESMRKFDIYIDKTRGNDSDRAKQLNIRRDDHREYSEDDGVYDRSPRGPRFANERPGPRRGAQGRSPPHGRDYLGPPQRGPGARSRQEDDGYGRRDGPVSGGRGLEPRDDHEEDYIEEEAAGRRRRGGGMAGGPARNRRRGYDDDYDY